MKNEKSVSLDYANMLKPNLGSGGLDPEELDDGYARAFREAHEDVESRRSSGEMGFFSLPDALEAAGAVQELADGFGQWFENLVVLGIGGSALGTTTLRDSLLGAHWNELDEEEREHFPRLYVMDNVDPRTVSALLDRLDLRPRLRAATPLARTCRRAARSPRRRRRIGCETNLRRGAGTSGTGCWASGCSSWWGSSGTRAPRWRPSPTAASSSTSRRGA